MSPRVGVVRLVAAPVRFPALRGGGLLLEPVRPFAAVRPSRVARLQPRPPSRAAGVSPRGRSVEPPPMPYGIA